MHADPMVPDCVSVGFVEACQRIVSVKRCCTPVAALIALWSQSKQWLDLQPLMLLKHWNEGLTAPAVERLGQGYSPDPRAAADIEVLPPWIIRFGLLLLFRLHLVDGSSKAIADIRKPIRFMVRFAFFGCLRRPLKRSLFLAVTSEARSENEPNTNEHEHAQSEGT